MPSFDTHSAFVVGVQLDKAGGSINARAVRGPRSGTNSARQAVGCKAKAPSQSGEGRWGGGEEEWERELIELGTVQAIRSLEAQRDEIGEQQHLGRWRPSYFIEIWKAGGQGCRYYPVST